jgi:hypothetical protein
MPAGSPATVGWKVQPEMASPLVSVALDHAAKNDADPVFEWPGTAKASHKIDIIQAEVARSV